MPTLEVLPRLKRLLSIRGSNNMIKRAIGLGLCGIFLAGCSSTRLESVRKADLTVPVPVLVSTQAPRDDNTVEKLGRAAATPLSDLNLVREAIPEVLRKAQQDPWIGREWGCDQLLAHRQALASALGRDIPTKDRDILDKGYDFAEKQAVGVVQRTVEGVVPFRSWVRKLSGAEKHSKEIQSAIAAGNTQYAYLTGVYHAKSCEK